ncbi:MAG: D-glycerate dehydrogenase [Acidimicrobiia bacterium]|nr:D-glycerate dehydrogenase [Acidimicrobiia bacterium]
MVVAVTRWLPPPGIGPLERAGFDVRYQGEDRPPGRDELLALVHGARAILTLLTERVDDDLLDAAGPGLEVVANLAVGYDNVDVAACRARDVAVTNTPGVLTEATADLTWALVLAATRRLGEGERLVRRGEWTGWRPGQLLGAGLQGKVLGIFGMGQIGAAVARRGSAFGMAVRYTNRTPRSDEADLGARWAPLGELLATADVLVLNAPATPETRHVINSTSLGAMKPGAVLVNTARGPLVDEAALVDALRSGQLRAAGLDVYEHEPQVHPGLLELEQVVLAPHLGSATDETRAAMVQLACDNIIAVLAGESPLTPVG